MLIIQLGSREPKLVVGTLHETTGDTVYPTPDQCRRILINSFLLHISRVWYFLNRVFGRNVKLRRLSTAGYAGKRWNKVSQSSKRASAWASSKFCLSTSPIPILHQSTCQDAGVTFIMVTIESIFEALDFFPEPARLCQTFFLLSASAVLVVAATPPSTRGLLTQYGARSSSPAQKTKEQIEAGNANKFTNLIRSVTSVGNVPHSWFIHFYILSVANSFFWALQYACNGTVLETIAKHQTARNPGPSMTLRQVQLTWFLMATQGARRLYECLFVMRASSSKMWVIHWLLGCAYYLCIGVAVWVEGAGE